MGRAWDIHGKSWLGRELKHTGPSVGRLELWPILLVGVQSTYPGLRLDRFCRSVDRVIFSSQLIRTLTVRATPSLQSVLVGRLGRAWDMHSFSWQFGGRKGPSVWRLEIRPVLLTYKSLVQET